MPVGKPNVRAEAQNISNTINFYIGCMLMGSKNLETYCHVVSKTHSSALLLPVT